MNKVTLMGRIGKDPESKFTPSGVQVTNMSLATTERFKDRSGEKQEKTTVDKKPKTKSALWIK